MENPIKLHVPISVSYQALEDVLKQKAVGEYIPKPEAGMAPNPYAQILDIGLTGSSDAAYDITLWLNIRILRTVLKRDAAPLRVQAKLGYDNASQQLSVLYFKLASQTSSGFFNAGLEVLANKVAYAQILKKASISLQDILAKALQGANSKLAPGLAMKGLELQGEVKEIKIYDVIAQPNGISLILDLQGNIEVDIADLRSLMPA